MTNETSKNSISRRSMLVASGAAVATTAVAGPLSAASNDNEVLSWKKRIGENYNLGPNGMVRLVGVEIPDWRDPNRPQEFRKPFILIFKPQSNRRKINDGSYVISGRSLQAQRVFVNETKLENYSREPVLQAVFS